MIFTPSFASSRRFNSLPGRMKLSTPVTCKFSDDSSSARVKVLPTNPQMPVMRSFIGKSQAHLRTTSPSPPPKGGEGRGEEANCFEIKIPSPQPSPRFGAGRGSRKFGFKGIDSTGNDGLVNLLQNRFQIELVFPIGIVLLKFPHVADPPDMVADAVVLDVSPVEFFAADFFAERNRFEHRTVRVTAATQVINFAGTRLQRKLPERLDEVATVNVVANLLALVTEHAIRPARGGASHQVGEKTVQLRARVRRAGETAAAKTHRLHAEVTSVFLHQNVRRNFARAEQRMFRLVNAHRFVNALAVFVRRVNFPALLQFAQRQKIRRVAINFVRAGENENRPGAMLPC